MIKIYGAGMAGLIAANMLRNQNDIEVLEHKSFLPDNHGALLRFRTDAVAVASGIPFKKVLVQKAIYTTQGLVTEPRLDLCNQYAQKVTGSVSSRSILNLDPVERFIAPPDFLMRLSKGINIKFDSRITSIKAPGECPVISTIPMTDMLKMSGWDLEIGFKWKGITTYRAVIDIPNIDIYQTIYYPSEIDGPYRASITGNVLIVECIGKRDLKEASLEKVLKTFGIDGYIGDVVFSYQPYGKLLPTSEEPRRAFITALTEKYNIYSLGRFATWRQLLMDDVVKDVALIGRWIQQSNSYSRLLER